MTIRIRLSPGPVLVALLFARTLVHALLAAWTPLSGLDWDQYTWLAERDKTSTLTVLANHPTVAKLVEYLIARSDTLHVIATPFIGTMLLVLAFAFARKRMPTASWDDVLDIAVLSALIWIGEPRCGLVYTYRPYVAQAVWPAAIVLATLLPYRCGWRVRAPWLVPFALGAFVSGTAIYALSVPALAGIGWAIARARSRPAWMWVGLAALLAGAATMLAMSPSIDGRLWTRGIENNLTALGSSLREHGELIAMVAALGLVAIAANALRPGWANLAARTDDAEDLVAAPRWVAVWVATVLLALLGPLYNESTLLPGTIVLAIAALPFVRLLARPLGMRILIAVVVAAVTAGNWASGLAMYARLHGEYEARLDTLHATKASGIAVVKPYSEIHQSFWFYGEDWGKATVRETVARGVFGLADIEMATPFRTLERSARLSMTLETTGAKDAQLLEARRPNLWPRDLNVARLVFLRFAGRFERGVPKGTAHLAITNLDSPVLKGRPVYVGWVEDGKITVPRAKHASPDTEDRYQVPIDTAIRKEFPELLAIGPKGPVPVTLVDGKLAYAPMDAGLWWAVACNDQRCIAVDAFMLDLN